MHTRQKKPVYPTKRRMNLYYKPDRTTYPSTVALYLLFALVVLLGLAKLLVYDVWMEYADARDALAAQQQQLDAVMAELADYDEVRREYSRYAATEAERELVDRMAVLNLLQSTIQGRAVLSSVAISGRTALVDLADVTLTDTALIVKNLEASALVAGITVDTAARAESSERVSASIMIELQREEAQP